MIGEAKNKTVGETANYPGNHNKMPLLFLST